MKTTFVLALSLLCLLVLQAPAQEFRATISGHVYDSSGAAVPNTKIQVTNLATNEMTSAVADNSGAYTIPLLRPGNYKLTATAAGFKQYTQDNVTLEAAKVLGLDLRLEVGNITESIEVTAEALALETQS